MLAKLIKQKLWENPAWSRRWQGLCLMGQKSEWERATQRRRRINRRGDMQSEFSSSTLFILCSHPQLCTYHISLVGEPKVSGKVAAADWSQT